MTPIYKRVLNFFLEEAQSLLADTGKVKILPPLALLN
jgi:hypothetical protein